MYIRFFIIAVKSYGIGNIKILYIILHKYIISDYPPLTKFNQQDHFFSWEFFAHWLVINIIQRDAARDCDTARHRASDRYRTFTSC